MFNVIYSIQYIKILIFFLILLIGFYADWFGCEREECLCDSSGWRKGKEDGCKFLSLCLYIVDIILANVAFFNV